MSFLKNITAFLPVGKKEQEPEYFFAVNIGIEKITAALWTIAGNKLKILDTAASDYSSLDELTGVADKLLDQVLGLKEIEPQKILFGVPNIWLSDDNLKDEYLKILRSLVKELELTPMAYVATSEALAHFLEKSNGVPATAILVNFEKEHLAITVVRAGKIDGVKVVKRGDSSGSDIEKALLTFTDVETLPSKILIYGSEAQELKSQLLSFSWMAKLSFLHFPKIEVLDEDINIKSVCLAGGAEMSSSVIILDQEVKKELTKKVALENDQEPAKEHINRKEEHQVKKAEKSTEDQVIDSAKELGFVVGDIADTDQGSSNNPGHHDENAYEDQDNEETSEESNVSIPHEHNLEIDDFEQEQTPATSLPVAQKTRSKLLNLIPGNFIWAFLIGVIGVIAVLGVFYMYFFKAHIKVFVEPKVLEKDAQIIADPKQKDISEENKIIPGQIVETEISGTAKDSASGRKQIGDPAKGTIKIYNKTFERISLSKGTQITGSAGIKFTLDTSISIASASASDTGISYGKPSTSPTVTAVAIGADGNLPSGANLTIAGYSGDKLTVQTEGNFSGGTSKEVTVVSSEDTQRLLAKLSADLRKQAQQKLQEQYPQKKILEEALAENISKKSYSKNINDQASEFSLNMTDKFKGTAFDDADLKSMVGKLVNTQVPDGFQLNIADTETQADVSKLEKDGKLIFLAKFKAKLLPKIDSEKIKNQIKFKTPQQAGEIIKGMENILGSEISLSPDLPIPMTRLPFLTKNITVEVGLK